MRKKSAASLPRTPIGTIKAATLLLYPNGSSKPAGSRTRHKGGSPTIMLQGKYTAHAMGTGILLYLSFNGNGMMVRMRIIIIILIINIIITVIMIVTTLQ